MGICLWVLTLGRQLCMQDITSNADQAQKDCNSKESSAWVIMTFAMAPMVKRVFLCGRFKVSMSYYREGFDTAKNTILSAVIN